MYALNMDNPMMRAISGIGEYSFWTTAAIRLDHEPSSFLHQSHAKLHYDKKECPRSTVTQKKDKRQLSVWHKIKIFSLIFLLEDKCNLKSNKSCEDCVQDGVR